MIWTIARKQLLINVMTQKFVIGFVLCQLLFLLSAVILTRDYEERRASYSAAASQHARQLRQIKVYAQLTITVDRPPAQLSPLCEGFDKRLASEATLSYTRIPEISVGQGEKNPLMVVLKSFDLVAIVQIVLSLLALFFAYDVVSGEREQGTLALTLSHALPRHKMLMGQYLGGMMTLLPMVLVGMILALFVMISSSSIAFSSQDWMCIGLIVVISLIYLSTFHLFAILVSTIVKRSATSLTVLLFCWIVLVVLFPHASAYLAHHIRPVEAKAMVDARARNLRSEMWQRLWGYAKKHPPPPHRWEFIKGRSVYTGDIPYPIMIYYAPREIMLWELEGLKYCLRLNMEYAERIHDLYRSYERTLLRQADLAKMVARLSPAWVYTQAASILAGTDADHYLRFLERARRYRHVVIDYVESKDGLFSLAYFTRRNMNELLTTAELEALRKSRGRRAIDDLIGRGWDEVPPLDLRDMPTFDPFSDTIDEQIKRALPELGILIFLNLVLFLLSHVAFLRADVRAD